MRRTACLVTLSLFLAAAGAVTVSAQSATYGFGFGGPMAMAFFPDMTGINTFMSENGLDPMGDFLIGAGGNGRGGVIGGGAAGGIGWGVTAESVSGDRRAELVFGGGGFDMGAAVGGSDSSVLTVGLVLGGGANVLTLTGPPIVPTNVGSLGLVPEPTPRELGRVVGFVQPYVSMAARLLPWMGFEFRVGYVFPVLGFDFGDQLGVPAPSLNLSGPTVSFGLVFGGIGSIGAGPEDAELSAHREVTQVSSGSFGVEGNAELAIENALGDIVISSYAAEDAQTGSSVVEWQATRTAKERDIDELYVESGASDIGATLTTSGVGRVDYVLRIPSGVDLRVRNGTGDVTLVGHDAMTIILETGVGEVNVQDVSAAALIVASGVGELRFREIDAQTLIADLGLGEITLALPPSASATLMAKAGIGNVTIDRFPGMTGGVHGLLGKSGNVTLGSGERTIELKTGIGAIDVQLAL